MCKVYNTVGALNTVKTQLNFHSISDFKSIAEIQTFQRTYFEQREEVLIKSRDEVLMEQSSLAREIEVLEQYVIERENEEIKMLRWDLDQLKNNLITLRKFHQNLIKTTVNYFKEVKVNRKIKKLERNFEVQIKLIIGVEYDKLSQLKTRKQYLDDNFEEAVLRHASMKTNELDRKKNILDSLNSDIYGAIGENMVAKEIEKLSNDFVLLNDFKFTFQPPIFYHSDQSYIRSMQIDHLLVAPSGIFLIETKNWSAKSISSLDMRSPIQQIKRSNFGLYTLVNKRLNTLLDQHHWGERKIPIRNLIAMIHHKPNGDFEHVKILTLKELRGYVESFKRSFSPMEVEMIARELNEYSNISV